MAGLSEDALADLYQLVAELEQRLESSFVAHDAAIAREAAVAQENAGLRNELAIARDREAASADIFRTISRKCLAMTQNNRCVVSSKSPRACSTLRASASGSPEDGEWVKTVYVGRSSESIESAVPAAQVRIGSRSLPGTVVAENRQIHMSPTSTISIPAWPIGPACRIASCRRRPRDIRHAACGAKVKAIGVLIVHRDQPVPFTSSEELALQQSFADQAAIAIENARLFNETQEALERQTATADILKVIASSPSDATPVFEAIAGSAKRLLGGFSTAVFRFVDGTVHLAAFTPTNPAADEALRADFPQPIDRFAAFQLASHGKPLPIPDTEEVTHAPVRDIARLHGFRSMLFVPMMNDAVSIGIISVTRAEPGVFALHHVQLLQTFADQAVIAIENTRLFEEVQAKTRDVTEALEQQIATAEVLTVISNSSGDLPKVFDAMLDKAMRLCGAEFGVLNTYNGETFRTEATRGLPPEYDAHRYRNPAVYGPRTAPARLLEGELHVQILDLMDSDAYRAGDIYRRALVDLGGARSLLAVPLLRDREVIGNVMIFRQESRAASRGCRRAGSGPHPA